MKSIKWMLSAIASFAFFTAQAQTKTTLPDWGVAGYDNATYYYIPDIETYYDVRTKNYVYLENGKWTRTTALPESNKDYDLYSGYKVIITDDKEPFANYDKMKLRYAKGYKGVPQKTYKVNKRK